MLRETKGKNEEKEEEEEEEVYPLMSRVVANSMAFTATTLVVVGELLNEHNIWAVVVIGGLLCGMNVLLTASGFEKSRKGEEKEREKVAIRKMTAAKAVRFGLKASDQGNKGKKDRIEEDNRRKGKEKRRKGVKDDGRVRTGTRRKERRERSGRRGKKRRVEVIPPTQNQGLYTVLNI